LANTVELFTDGACKGNPGPGGWGALLRFQDQEKELYGGEANTTNNRIKGSQSVRLHTDSKYVMDGINEWMPNWKKRGWKTAAKKPVKNADLWRQLDEAVARHTVDWEWVKGHSGHRENEIADQLANKGAEPYL